MTIAPPNSKLLLIFIAGSAAIAGQIVIGALMMALAPSPEWVVAGVVVSFLLGVPLGILLTRALPALAFPAMGVFALTGLVPAFVIDVPLWGRVVDLRQVNAVPIATGIAGYVAPGWHIDTSRASQERLTASRGSRGYGFRRIAPLVGKGWTPEHPVGIWVSGETRDSGRVLPWHPQFWSEPGGEFVRLVGKNVSGAQLAACSGKIRSVDRRGAGGRHARAFGRGSADRPALGAGTSGSLSIRCVGAADRPCGGDLPMAQPTIVRRHARQALILAGARWPDCARGRSRWR